MAIHLPTLLDKFKMLPTCFTLERTQRTFKGFGLATTKLLGYEKSLTLSMLNEQLRDWMDGSCFRRGIFLIDPRLDAGDFTRTIGADNVWCSAGASYDSKQFWAGDFVVFLSGSSTMLGRLELNCFVEPHPAGTNGYVNFVEAYRPAATNLWVSTSEAVCIPMAGIVGAAIWSRSRDGVRIIKPGFVEYTT